MKIIIPAAGIGSRLRPQTHTIPKSLLHVAGKPILGHILDSLQGVTFDEIILITGFLGDDIREYVSEHYDFTFDFIHQEELHGLGYAVHMGLERIDGDDSVLILLGDTIVETAFDEFLCAGENVLGLMKVPDPQRFGIAEIKDDVVVNLVEKPANPKSNLAIIGLYYISESAKLRQQLDKLIAQDERTRGEIQLTDALQGMIEDGSRFAPYAVDGWYDCGKRETLIATNKHLLEKIGTPPAVDGAIIIPPVFIAPSAVIEASVIGPNVSISEKAIIRESIIKNSIIGFEAEVRNALLTDSLIGHRSTVFGEYRALNVGDSSEIGYY